MAGKSQIIKRIKLQINFWLHIKCNIKLFNILRKQHKNDGQRFDIKISECVSKTVDPGKQMSIWVT